MAERAANKSSRKASSVRLARPKASDSFTKAPPAADPNRQKSPPNDPDARRRDYAAAGRQLRQWLWAGLLLVVLGIALWIWGPREQLAAEAATPTGSYFFRQAGTVQGTGNKNWVWILADTADQAKVLLSADQGHTWQVRDLGIARSRARAMALGWAAPGKGLIVGDSGWVRTIEDVFEAPGQGQDQRLAGLSATTFRSVAVDPQGRRAVAAGTDNSIWTTTNDGQSWQKLMPSGRLVAYWPGRGSFVVVSDRTVRELSFGSGETANITISAETMWNQSKSTDSVATVAFEETNGGFLFTTHNGEAVYWRQRRPTGNPSATGADAYAALPVSLFAPNAQAVTLAFWQPNQLDSALLLANTAAGGQIQRIAVKTQLTGAIASVDNYFTPLIAAPPPAKPTDGRDDLSQTTKPPIKNSVAARKPLGQKQAASAVTRPAPTNQRSGGNAKGSNGSPGKNDYPLKNSTPKDQDFKESTTEKLAAPKSENDVTEKYPMSQQASPTRRQSDSLNTQAKQQAARNYKKKE